MSKSETTIAAGESLATTFIVVRHGQTVWNEQGRWQGWLDSPLTQTGIAQAHTAAEALAGESFTAAYSSDSGRAIETARIVLTRHTGVPLHTTQALRERNYGGFEGLNTEEIDARFPGARFKHGRDTRDNWCPPQGETLTEVRERVQGLMNELTRRHPGQTVLLVTHSNVVRIIDALCCGQPLEEIWHRVPPNACVFIVKGTPEKGLRVVKHFCE